MPHAPEDHATVRVGDATTCDVCETSCNAHGRRGVWVGRTIVSAGQRRRWVKMVARGGLTTTLRAVSLARRTRSVRLADACTHAGPSPCARPPAPSWQTPSSASQRAAPAPGGSARGIAAAARAAGSGAPCPPTRLHPGGHPPRPLVPTVAGTPPTRAAPRGASPASSARRGQVRDVAACTHCRSFANLQPQPPPPPSSGLNGRQRGPRLTVTMDMTCSNEAAGVKKGHR
jgi:hypothetical protein